MHLRQPIVGLLLLSAVILPSSCSVDELPTPKDELYARQFVKDFGIPAAGHDWNTAKQNSITVITSSPTNVKILADVNGKRYLFADYRNVNGKQEIPVTVPKTVNEVIISANGSQITSTLGSTVDLTGGKSSRLINEGTNGVLTFGPTAEKHIFPATYIGDAMALMPEDGTNIHNEGVIADFSFISEAGKQITIYPVFWDTRSSHVLGIYWLNDDGSFPWCKNADELNDAGVTAELSYANMQDIYYTRSGELNYCKNYYTEKDESKHVWTRTYGKSSYPGGFATDDKGNQYRPGAFRARGITFKFNKSGINFGFYIKVKDKDPGTESFTVTNEWGQQQTVTPYQTLDVPTDGGPCTDYDHIIFSHTRRNKNYGRVIKIDGKYYPSSPQNNPNDDKVIDWGKSTKTYVFSNPWSDETDLLKYAGAAYFKIKNRDGKTRTFFAFEDWRIKPADFNDLIFLVDGDVNAVDDEGNPLDGSKPTPAEPFEWIIAAEDLGGTFDWDFNDMVAKVSCVAKNDPDNTDVKYTEVTVTPLAAGGTLPIYLMYTGKIYDTATNTATDAKDYVINTEFHNWLGGSSLSPINVGETASATGKSVTFYAPEGYTMASAANNKYDAATNNMGGFSVLVGKPGETLTITGDGDMHELPTLPEGSDHKVEAPKPDDANATVPQIICVESNWLWPRETIDIRTAYAGFSDWITTPSTEWYGEGKYDANYIVTQKQ